MTEWSIRTHSCIGNIAPSAWNDFVNSNHPFLRHEFLAALEHQGCVGEEYGWIPHHLTLEDCGRNILAAVPCYLKFNSYGEFVFDWSWADAHHRVGRPYYPKLVIAAPYTPATGPRILTKDNANKNLYAKLLIQGAVRQAHSLGVSSLHLLFASEQEARSLEQDGLLLRMGCQFHWQNRGYTSFEHLLSTFSSRRRNNVKRERRRVVASGLRFRRLLGPEVNNTQWEFFHRLYRSTFDRRGGIPTLSLGFFQEIAKTMGDNLLLVLAYHGDKIVAAAFNLVGSETLYGRHWGCSESFHSLHFETCYYQGLDFCINQRLCRFEPGAQGEYKIRRGFLPTPTWSVHWIAEPRLRGAIAKFLATEREYVEAYLAEMGTHSPYRDSPSDALHPT